MGTVCLLVGTSFCLSPFFSSLYFLFSLSLSLLCLGLFSPSSLASSSSHLLLPSWLLVLPVPLMCLLGWGIEVSLPSCLAPSNFSYQPLPSLRQKQGLRVGGGFWHSTPQLQARVQGRFPYLSVHLLQPFGVVTGPRLLPREEVSCCGQWLIGRHEAVWT